MKIIASTENFDVLYPKHGSFCEIKLIGAKAFFQTDRTFSKEILANRIELLTIELMSLRRKVLEIEEIEQ